ncbi:SixA phosphatase family protein [Kocuria sp. HSID16901]|uniref:SixA phosphatase family protein n=1 Tax=Kocuria sp. HSID16901 TaxID=2419505 RepID=UPI00065FE75E|nr:histidine phosphatase family protein [Kocuria sp. HSID16901]MCT1368112.1 histidine phosphatase family protein [Rothia sp. p3-SID1597]
MSPLIDPRSQAKILMIMRHAEAEPPWGTSDFDRPLTRGGHATAPKVGQWMAEQSVVPEMIASSSALRTRQTCTWVCDALGEKAPTASLENRLYNPPTRDLLSVIGRTPETVQSLLVISHFPAVQESVLHLASRESDYDAVMDASSGFPPAGLAVLTLDKPWAALDGADAVLRAFVTNP